jgi:hypothetical protein
MKHDLIKTIKHRLIAGRLVKIQTKNNDPFILSYNIKTQRLAYLLHANPNKIFHKDQKNFFSNSGGVTILNLSDMDTYLKRCKIIKILKIHD